MSSVNDYGPTVACSTGYGEGQELRCANARTRAQYSKKEKTQSAALSAFPRHQDNHLHAQLGNSERVPRAICKPREQEIYSGERKIDRLMTNFEACRHEKKQGKKQQYRFCA